MPCYEVEREIGCVQSVDRMPLLVRDDHVDDDTIRFNPVFVRLLRRNAADVVGDVKVQGVASGRFENDVVGVAAKRLESLCESDRDLRLVWTEKHFDLEWPVLEQAKIFRLDILKIDENEIRSHHSSAHEVYER